MNPLVKTAFRKEVIAEMGNKLDDSLESATKDISKYEGAKQELLKAAKGILNLHKTLEGEFNEGKSIKDGMDAKEVRDLCKRWLDRAYGIVENLAQLSAVMEQQAYGKQAALKDSVAYAKKLFDTEASREETILRALAAENEDLKQDDAPRGNARNSGTHPGMSIAQRRRAEEAQRASGSNGDSDMSAEEIAALEAELLG